MQKIYKNLQFFLNIFFPPLCMNCKERCSTKLLCPACWLLCELPDPASRCRHCFEEMDERSDLCRTCRKEKMLSIIRAYVFAPESPAHFLGVERVEAMAGFALLQWIQLEWPIPDAVIPMPGSHNIAAAFANFLQIPLVKALSPFHEYVEDRLEEDQTLLLFDVSNPNLVLSKAAFALSGSFPKKMHLLSLYPYVDCIP